MTNKRGTLIGQMMMIDYDIILTNLNHHINLCSLSNLDKRGTLIEQMMMINYDFILTNHNHHNNQRSFSIHIQRVFDMINTMYK